LELHIGEYNAVTAKTTRETNIFRLGAVVRFGIGQPEDQLTRQALKQQS
jgi:hypothetical protein